MCHDKMCLNKCDLKIVVLVFRAEKLPATSNPKACPARHQNLSTTPIATKEKNTEL